MSSRVLRLYHLLPPSARSAAATLRGGYLRLWRYGADAERLAEEATLREQWTADQWNAWRAERLAFVLHRAATKVPYYRNQWQTRRRQGDGASWDLLENWMLLEKETVRANSRAFLAEDCDPRLMSHEQTSGTTGTPLELWRSRTTVAALYALASTRTRGWDHIPADARWGRLGGQLVTPVAQRRPPFWVWNAAMRQLYLSSYHLAPDLIPHYLDALAAYRIQYLAGYPSALTALARQALRLERRDLRLLAVYTNAEPLSTEQRQTIKAAFHCPVRETYGMAETVAAASECSGGRLHQWPEIGMVELRADGEMVCTGLLNADMPLIRYRVGDRGRHPGETSPCACGRGLPSMGPIDGRSDDVLLTSDGRLAGPVDLVFDGLAGIREAQIVQEQIDVLRVRVARAPEYLEAYDQMIIERLRQRMGDVRVIVDGVAAVPRTANGKLRAVVCNLSPAERAAALRRMEAAP